MVYCHVNKTSQQYTAVYTTYSHVLDGKIKAIAANWCLIVRTWGGDTPATLIVCPTLGRQHQHAAQWYRNIQTYVSKCLGIQKVCLVFKRLHRNILKIRKTEKNKIMICGIHYFIIKLKRKMMSFQAAALSVSSPHCVWWMFMDLMFIPARFEF